jgi:hypothetical protein
MHTKFWFKNMNEKKHFEDLNVSGTIILMRQVESGGLD